MTENEILLVVADLLIAMQTEDLEETKKLVNFLNKNFIPIDKIPNLNELVPVYSLYSDNENNESYIYVVNNLEGLTNTEQLKWNLAINLLMKKNDKIEMENFLQNILSSLDSLEEYQINSLIRLSIKANRYDLLKNIRDFIKEGGK